MKTITRVVGWLCVGAVVFVALSLIIANTSPGKRLLAAWISALASRADGLHVEIEGITGVVPLRFGVTRLRLADPHGVWLEIGAVQARTKLGALLRGVVRFAELHAKTVDLARLPELPPDEADEQDGEPPQTLRAFQIDALRIERLRAGHALFERGENAKSAEAAGAVSEKWSTPVRVVGRGTYWVHLRALDASLSAEADGIVGLVPPDVDLGCEAVRFEGRATGAITAPSVHAKLSLRQARFGTSEVGEARLVLDGAPGASSGTAARYRVAVETSVHDPHITRFVDALIGREARLRAEAEYDPAAARLRIASIELDAAAVRARTSGEVQSNETVELPHLRIDLTGLAALPDPAATVVDGGTIGLEATVDADLRQGRTRGRARLEADALDLDDPALERFVGPRVVLSGNFETEQGVKVVRVRDLELQAEHAELRANAVVHAEDPLRMEANVSVVLRDAAALGRLIGIDLSGYGEAELSAHGPISNLMVDAVLRPRDVRIAGGPALNGEIVAHAADVTNRARGRLRADLSSSYGKVGLVSEFSLAPDESLRLSASVLESNGALVRGSADVDLKSRLVDGSLTGELRSLAVLTPFIGRRLEGSGRFEVVLRGEADQSAELRASLDHFALLDPDGASADGVRLDTTIRHLRTTPAGTFLLQVDDALLAGVAVARARLSGQGDRGLWDAAFHAEGRYGEPWRTDARARMRLQSDAMRLDVTAFEGEVGRFPVRLARPLHVRRAEDKVNVEELELLIGEGRIAGSGTMDANLIRGSFTAKALPLALLRLFEPALDLRGPLDATLELEGARDDPRFTFALSSQTIEIGRLQQADVPPMALEARGEWATSGLDADARLSGGEITELAMRVRVPRDRARPLAAELRGAINLGLVNGLGVLGEDRIAGVAQPDLRVTGSLAEPDVAGGLRITDGLYENAALGMLLRDIDGVLTAHGNRFAIERFTATDGGGGSLQGGGAIDFQDGVSAARYRVELNARALRVARLDHLRAQASGDLSLTGVGGRAALTGDIVAERADVTIPERLPEGVVELDVVETNIAAARADRYVPERQPHTVPLDLDLRVSSPGRVFVRGSDVDTEWEGTLVVRGTSETPLLDGKLKVVRGTFNLLNVRFKIVDGTIVFEGEEEIDPVVDLTAETRKHGILARVVVRGRASRLRLSFASEPPLPEDEILSRVLFGKQPSALSPAESLQLAAAVARLSGSGGGRGLDPLGWLRRTFGVDTLNVTSADGEGGGSVLSIGKYIADGVFVRLNQGLTESTSTAAVELEVTRNITLDTEVGSDAQGSLGLNWKLDY